jgi:tetratricopeptide (TPR) repeat protein
VAEIPEGYKIVSEEDRKKAQRFFENAKTRAETNQLEYAIEMYLEGLKFDPEAIEAHQAIRELAVLRKLRGGKPLGMFQKPKSSKDDLQNMLNAEKVLAYDPGSVENMEQLMVAARKAGCYDTVLWIGAYIMRANNEAKQPSFARYIRLKDNYKAIGRFKEAVDAMAYAVNMKKSDMDLAHEMKNLAAEMTISKGGYSSGGAFRDSVRDMDAQKKLLELDTDVRTEDSLARAVQEAKQDYEQDTADVGKFSRYIEALRKTEQLPYENQAIELLEQKYRETKQYRFKQSINQITLTQLGRQERSYREEVQRSPNDPEVKKEYNNFRREKTEQELRIFTETVENYPTDTVARFEMGKRLFMLERYDEAIPVFQQSRMDPKFKVQASILLGRAFLQAQFVDEAVDTLQEAIQGYQVRGDERAIEMHYYYANALEKKGDIPAAIKTYSQVAQWNFNYRDVQQRIKRLRAGGQPPPPAQPQGTPAPA